MTIKVLLCIVLLPSAITARLRIHSQAQVNDTAGNSTLSEPTISTFINATETSFDLLPRQLAPTAGTTKALAVRLVTSSGQQPTETLDMMRGQLMGKGGPYQTDNHFRSQYRKCSFGKQRMRAATSSDGNGITNGIVQVKLNFEIAGCNLVDRQAGGGCQTKVVNAIAASLGRTNLSHLDFVLICVPRGSLWGTDPNWSAFSYYTDNVSFYQTGNCGHISTAMHETGHTMGFGHSNKDGIIRNDLTGVLGRGLVAVGFPLYCLNGHKYHLSGWMDDTKQAVSFSEGTGYLVRLVAFVDKGKTGFLSTDRTLLHLPGDFFVLYNRAKDFNVGTRAFGDTVTIVQQNTQSPRESDFVGALSLSGSRSILVGGRLVVEVCNQGADNYGIDYAMVSVYDRNLGQRTLCA